MEVYEKSFGRNGFVKLSVKIPYHPCMSIVRFQTLKGVSGMELSE